MAIPMIGVPDHMASRSGIPAERVCRRILRAPM
jgi:hypothetical protein